MQIQVHTDNHIEGSEGLTSWVQGVVDDAFGHIRDRITRVDVHLGDENADKGGDNDKRCTMEVRVEGRHPTAVTQFAATINQAVDGAAERARRAVEHDLERLRERH
jgi:hypothetical protein